MNLFYPIILFICYCDDVFESVTVVALKFFTDSEIKESQLFQFLSIQ